MKIILILIILFFVASVLAIDNSTNVSYEDNENSGPEINNSNETDGAGDSGGGGGGGSSGEINESLNQSIINNSTNQTGDADLNLTEESSSSGGGSSGGGSSSRGSGSSGGSGSGGSSSSGAHSGNSSGRTIDFLKSNQSELNKSIESVEKESNDSIFESIGPGITGGAIGTRKKEIKIGLILIIGVIGGVVGLSIWRRKKRKKWKNRKNRLRLLTSMISKGILIKISGSKSKK